MLAAEAELARVVLWYLQKERRIGALGPDPFVLLLSSKSTDYIANRDSAGNNSR